MSIHHRLKKIIEDENISISKFERSVLGGNSLNVFYLVEKKKTNCKDVARVQHSSTKFTDDSIESPKINQGDILIFDGELEHYVPANNCTSPRLTVAFTFDAEPMVPKGNKINTENIFPKGKE